ncbi:hypothetical protein RRSWK_05546 [Rhodopirellula sp. SWK7]|nr:hypothetical protein RRSWK_05546 [Rhodopirellula sp. SWK7]
MVALTIRSGKRLRRMYQNASLRATMLQSLVADQLPSSLQLPYQSAGVCSFMHSRT